MSRWRALSPRDRRALLLGGAVAMLAVLVSLVVRPSLARRTLLADQIDAEQSLLTREQEALTASGDSTGGATADAAAGRDPIARLFVGSDDVATAAAFAEHVEALATAHGVWLQLVSNRTAVPGDAQLRTLRVDVRAESDMAGLLGFLEALEHGPRLVRVEQLELAPSSGAADDGTAPLLMTATLAAFAATTAVPAAGGAATATMSRVPVVDAEAVLARDPFSPERRAPDVRYQPPRADAVYVERGTDDDLPTDEPQSMTMPVVHGTATDASGAAFAMCALDGGPVVVLRAGDTLGPFTVLSIERARVQFRDASGRRYLIDAMAPPEGAVR
ncbi:type II secretion system protein GspM [Gemmatimonas sp.]|jgi:type II secretory pathway component PulM|uniref:type II secretion system protein GspM n=1 Tax=Gemmatimonas sp. TaxID=1962908 RepID=UPI0025BC1FC8|nr:type II secretion system protein GspM [Gemmatimonas sp.]MCA2985018.1 type II secretion system protein M [Gemmatimonas sp.]MCA2995723.1 type II secretion system protein M [Gemmatimonas sp.]MCE2954001.1 type II secretion system protein M [Gemmatimonas sp.]